MEHTKAKKVINKYKEFSKSYRMLTRIMVTKRNGEKMRNVNIGEEKVLFFHILIQFQV